MSEVNKKLPEYDNPPLIEVVLSIQFEVPAGYQNIYARDIWSQFEADFPTVQEQAELPPMFEMFGGMVSNQPRVEFITGPSGNRYWFIKSDNTELIQFQKNRFLHNWRKVPQQGNPYPRFEAIFDSYSKELEVLQSFYVASGWGKLKINQCEVTYINHIPFTGSQDSAAPFKDLKISFVPESIDYSCTLRRVLLGQDKKPIGRLNVAINTAADIQRKPLLVADFTARGAPESADIDGALNLIRKFREEIVLGFTEMTTEQMHAIWGRRV